MFHLKGLYGFAIAGIEGFEDRQQAASTDIRSDVKN